MTFCSCGSEKPFADCCEPFLTLKENPRSVRQLVRARYCAYALGAGRHREFLIRTWHPATARSISIADLTNDNLTWKGLEILRAEQKGDYGRVEFKATFSDKEAPDQIHHEFALFNRIKGVWLYLEGKVT
jgi:SEC-C motif-containing protein